MLLFSVALRLSVWQLKPEILVCKMTALMINVAAERRKPKKKRDRIELLSLSMLIKAIYILYSVSPNKKCEGGKRVGDYGMLWDHLCNTKSHS